MSFSFRDLKIDVLMCDIGPRAESLKINIMYWPKGLKGVIYHKMQEYF